MRQKQMQNQKATLKANRQTMMLESLNILMASVPELEVIVKQEIAQNPLLVLNEDEEEAEMETPSEDITSKADDTKTNSDDTTTASESDDGSSEKDEFEEILKQTIDEAKELSEVLDAWNELHSDTSTPSDNSDSDDETQYEDYIANDENLKLEYLNEFDQYHLTENEYDFIYDLVDNCDAYGFLPKGFDIYELAESYGLDKQVADTLHQRVMQTFPKGISARNISECLYWQLDEEEQDTIVADIILDDFDALINRRYSQIARKYDVPEETILECRDRISHMDPKPGLRINTGKPQYIVPDILVVRIEEEFEILINDFTLPKIALSRRYSNILSQLRHDKDAVSYVRDKINSAKFLVRSVYMRNRTLDRVMRAIINHQRGFFYQCNGMLEPLNYVTLAAELGVNESTISRVVKSKYADTPFGIFLLKDFFCASAGKDKNYEAISKQSVVQQIKTMIDNEDSTAPLSDQEILDILKERKISVSRRVITKYREQLGIPNSRMRRK